MQSPPVVESEPERLAALRGTALLDTAAEPAFDELVALTARLLDAPIAAFNLVDAERQWTKAAVGMANGDQAPREISYCAHAIASPEQLVAGDARADARFAGNPMDLGFYIGTPVTAGGQRVGTLCIAGEAPREPTGEELETLRVLAGAVSAHVELARRERERADEADALRQLAVATSRLARVDDASELEEQLCVPARDLAGADGAVLWSAVAGDMLRAIAAVGSAEIVGVELPHGHVSASRQAFDRDEQLVRHRGDLMGFAGWGSAIFQPLFNAGVLSVFWLEERELSREPALIELLSGEAAVALERTVTLLELTKLSRVDALTGLGNRRAFDEQLARELKRAEREDTELALAMLDLDHFKDFNDAYGHPRGDRLLADAASAWQGCLRATDSLARYGGEEFALLAGRCDAEHAVALVDRLRAAVPDGQTCSAGVALWDRSESAEALLARADAALYAAKANGRDCTEIASPPGTARAPTRR